VKDAPNLAQPDLPSAAVRGDAHWSERRTWPALGFIVAVHAGALWGLMQVEAVREVVQEQLPIMVGLITLPPPEPPRIEPPPPRPAPPKPKRTPPMIVSEAPTPSAIEAPPPDPAPVAEAPPPQPPAPEPAPPAPIIPPNFVAAYLDNPAPAYPATSKRLGEDGTVVLRVRVTPEGRPDTVTVERSSGFARLDRAALDAVRQWKFVPARQGDRKSVV
jgi:protein TonB